MSFDFGTRLGLVFIVESATLSALAVSCTLLYIAYSAVAINRNAQRRWSTETHVHYYFLSLMSFDLIQAIGGMMDLQWVIDAEVTEGTLCTAQGAFKQMGDVGVAFSSMAIALHTFQILVFGWKPRPRFALFVILGICIIVALLVGVPSATQNQYYGSTGYWCWIRRDDFERIGLEYLWLWLACFTNIVVYVFIALVVKGIVVLDGRRIRLPTREEREQRRQLMIDSNPFVDARDDNAIAVQMFFYPAVYIITVLPIAAARFSEFSKNDVPFPVTAFADCLFASSGFLNTILYSVTRPRLLPHRSRSVTRRSGPMSPTLISRPPVFACGEVESRDGDEDKDMVRGRAHPYALRELKRSLSTLV